VASRRPALSNICVKTRSIPDLIQTFHWQALVSVFGFVLPNVIRSNTTIFLEGIYNANESHEICYRRNRAKHAGGSYIELNGRVDCAGLPLHVGQAGLTTLYKVEIFAPLFGWWAVKGTP
jgi:hypothetical protein